MKALNRNLFTLLKNHSISGVLTALKNGADPSWNNPSVTLFDDEPYAKACANAVEYAVLINAPWECIQPLLKKAPQAFTSEALMLAAAHRLDTTFNSLMGYVRQPRLIETASVWFPALVEIAMSRHDDSKLMTMQKAGLFDVLTDTQRLELHQRLSTSKYLPFTKVAFAMGIKAEVVPEAGPVV